jgi:hypothetical protein
MNSHEFSSVNTYDERKFTNKRTVFVSVSRVYSVSNVNIVIRICVVYHIV